MEPFVDGQLLAESKDFECQVAHVVTVFEERDKCRDECQREFDHV